MAKLTDRQRKRIIAERADGSSLRELAKKYHVSETTIRRTLKNDPETAQKVAQKKEQNTLDMLAFMDSRKDQAQSVIDSCLTALVNPEKIESASFSQIATALGIVVDKFASISAIQHNEIEDLTPLAELLKKK